MEINCHEWGWIYPLALSVYAIFEMYLGEKKPLGAGSAIKLVFILLSLCLVSLFEWVKNGRKN